MTAGELFEANLGLIDRVIAIVCRRAIIRFRFGSSMTVADISEMLRLPQRPLYRRIDSLLGRLRNALAAAGIDAGTAADLIGSVAAEMDFGLDDGKTIVARQSTSIETAAEEAR